MPPTEEQIARETRRLREFQREADRVSDLVLNTDLPWIDIEIQIEKLREEARRLFPGKDDLFELVYESRFRRLWEQWRMNEEEVHGE
jgi:hypothetical protein